MKFGCRTLQVIIVGCLPIISSFVGCGGGGSNGGTPTASSSPEATPPASSSDTYTDPAASTTEAPATPAPSPEDAYAGDPAAMSTPESDPTMGYTGDMSASGDMYAGTEGGMGFPGFNIPGLGMNGLGMNGQPRPVDPTPQDDDDYLTKAKFAFSIGKEAVAEQYFIAYLLTKDDEAPALLTQIRFAPGSLKPAFLVRSAVGIDLKAPTGIQEYRPIGRTPYARQGSAVDGGGGADMGSGQPQLPAGTKTFGDFTGKFGEDFVKEYENIWSSGGLCTVFRDVKTIVPPKPTVNGFNPMMAMNSMNDTGMSYDPTAGDAAAQPQVGPDGQPIAGPRDAAPRMRAIPGKQIVPGLLYLGTGSKNDLVAKAVQEGIDHLFLYEVNVTAKANNIQNETRLRLIATKDGGSIGATTILNSMKVDFETAKKGENDDLPKQIANIMRRFDAFKLVDLPKLEPAHARARIKKVIEQKPKNPLSAMMEIRLFHSMNLLSNEERDAAFMLLLGGKGVAFTGGTVEDREAVLAPMLDPYK